MAWLPAVVERVLYPAVLLALFAAQGAAFAQDNVPGQIESGQNGFAGMFAGLLVVALAALGLRHRRHEAMLARLKKLEAAVEERDDKIWTLEEKLARLRQLADAQGDIVIREDAGGFVTHASESFCTLMQRPAEEITGEHLTIESRGEINPIVHDDGSITYDQEILTPSGARWIAWKEVAIADRDGNLVETQRTGHDITARIASERALANASEHAESASRAKSRFLAVVSHEVRTPLNGVLGMANLLIDSGLSPEQLTYAKSIKTSGEALLSLIEEILDFSKIEAGRLDLESVPFDLSNLVTDVVELLAPRAQ
ncbi:MAG TPA: histidine kinase dimerization/phospho-acceptor domain-containing protein, partial [Xanthobacteraceae bacterium]|nr:histidine kinase dimerization/phospho-acceptor domain-containing protein [Xanthobacteraceae bacterium]